MRASARHHRRTTACALLATLALLAGCGSDDDWSKPHPRPAAVGALGPGFVDAKAPPAPEATIRPAAGSWDAVHPSKGYRVVLLRAGGDRPTRALTAAVARWADAEDVSLKTVTAAGTGQYIARISEAIALRPDLIVCAGNALVDPLSLVTPSHLDQQFLVLGAELAEPTHNVTAANWVGAAFRGEGLGASSPYDASTFTPERAGRAVRAGVAAVLHGLTGIVLQLD